MTQPPTAPPATAPGDRPAAATPPGGVPARTGPPTVPPTVPPQGRPAAPPARRPTAWAGVPARLRDAARTEPGRLRLLGAALAALLLLSGALGFWQIADRAAAADTVRTSSQPLSAGAADIHRSLTDANTTAATGFLAGADEDPRVRARYEDDIANAAARLSEAAAHSSSDAARRQITLLGEQLPVYTGLVETARANNRQGLPLGGAYLRYADQLMRDTLLPAAAELYALETGRFQRDLADARARPWPALAAGAAALGALLWAQRRHYLRTHRVFSPGLVAATAATAVLLGWLAGAHTLARGALGDAESGAGRSLSALHGAWTEALGARGAENMTLVARGAGDASEEEFQDHFARLVEGPDGGSGGLLTEAERLAGDDAIRDGVRRAGEAAREWRERHAAARELEQAGHYDEAVAAVIGGEASTGASFDEVDAALRDAVAREQERFTAAADRGRGRLTGLAQGAAVLAVAGAAGVALGVGRRLSEYR